MKRIRIDIAQLIREAQERDEALSTLGISKDKYIWNDDTEDVREKREADLTEELRRMIQ